MAPSADLPRDGTHTNGHSTNGHTKNGYSNHVYLIWGGEGWVAGHLYNLLKSKGQKVYATTVRMENREAILAELDRFQPTHVFNCAGATGRPNVDWCEDNKDATIRSNVIGTLNLTDCCFLKGIHITVMATGCTYPLKQDLVCSIGTMVFTRNAGIYEYDEAHPVDGPGYVETDLPTFGGSFYSYTKSRVEEIMRAYTNCLILRLRMPVSDDLHPRSFVTKITKYDHVVDIPNSQSILSDLLPAAVALADHSETGIYNFTNPGAISHNEILALFKKIVRPDFTWQNFTVEEQSKILKAGRSNCKLDSTKLVTKLREYGMTIPEVHDGYEQCFKRMAANGTR
jgi:3,5-epimerase/4-reductase